MSLKMSDPRFFFFIVLSIIFQNALSSPLRPRLSNGLALTPPMGWNTYNHYSCSPTEAIVHSNALALKSLGLADLGYHYVTIDCGWTLPDRLPNGTLQPNPKIFPSGYFAMGDFLHGLGLGFGVYQDGGIKTCTTNTVNQVGSLGHELIDAQTFASWGADLLKYDNCYSDEALGFPDTSYTPSVSPSGRYQNMSKAIATLAKPLLFQICEWGVDFPALWAPALGNTYRITNDIIPAWRTIPRILNQAVPQTSFAGPGHWFDLDMLEVGNNVFTTPEEQTHFSLWAILKSPLTIGCALNDTATSIPKSSLEILSNKDVIALNQDSMGVSASFKRRWTEQQYELWSGPLSGNRTVVAMINLANTPQNLTLDLPDVGLQTAATVKNIWAGTTTEAVVTSYTANVEAHGVMLLELSETTVAGLYAEPAQDGTKFTFSNVYGLTTSTLYTGLLTFATKSTTPETVTVASSSSSTSQTLTIPANSLTFSFSLTLTSSNANTLIVTSINLVPTILSITTPHTTFFPSTSFTLSGTSDFIACTTDLCPPVGSKIGNISPTGSASISIPRTAAPSPSTTTVTKFLSVFFINNDIAIATSFGSGTNTRNLTITVNGGTPVRIEVPLSGRSSELYSAMDGWGDTAIFGVSIPGLGVGDGNDTIVVGNVRGDLGVQSFGADFVGLSIWG